MAKGIRILSIIATFADLGIDFRQMVLDDIADIGGYNSGTGTYSSSVVVTEYMFDGLTFLDVETWDGGIMQGCEGMTGYWTVNNP